MRRSRRPESRLVSQRGVEHPDLSAQRARVLADRHRTALDCCGRWIVTRWLPAALWIIARCSSCCAWCGRSRKPIFRARSGPASAARSRAVELDHDHRLDRFARHRVAGRGTRAAAARCERRDRFPQRGAIIFITFCVIVVTLVGQGLSLIPLLRWLTSSG